MTSLAERVRADGVRFILAMFVNLHGKPCAKLVPATAVDVLESEGVGFAGYAAGAIGQLPQDPDVVVLPDVSSYAAIPFVREGLAIVQCDPTVEGRPWPFAPRVILRAMMERTAAHGTLQAGAEAEYFLVTRDPDGTVRPADSRDTSAQPCYDARGLTRMYDHLTEVADAMNTLGWGNYANDHEDGNGQFEQNFHFADAMTTADRVITLRYLIHVMAERRGMTATFMPKPFTDRTGNGLHVHLSLWSGAQPLFPATGPDSHGLGLSPTGYGFVAGLLDHAPALSAVIAPTVNSYKRSGATSTASGATWAPRRATYGGNDRTHLLRVPDGNRVELRGPDGSANPYLVAAAALGAGIDGIDRRADPGRPCRAGEVPDTASLLPQTLMDALDALDADPVVRGVLDCVDPGAGVADYFARIKREEFEAWHAQVSAWEIDNYLTAF